MVPTCLENELRLVELSQFLTSRFRIARDEHAVFDNNLLSLTTENKFEKFLQPRIERLE